MRRDKLFYSYYSKYFLFNKTTPYNLRIRCRYSLWCKYQIRWRPNSLYYSHNPLNMSTTFPTSLDSLTNPTPTSNMSVVLHSDQHINANDAIEALEAKVWVDNSAVTTSIDYLLKSTSSTDPWHKHTLSSIAQSWASSWDFAKWNGSAWIPAVPAWGWDILWPWVSVDSEIMLFSGTSGTSAKRATGTWLAKATSWVFSIATPATDYVVPWLATSSGITMSTGKILGRATASTGAIEEISTTGTWNAVLATAPTTTNQTLTTPNINVGSDANGDLYYRAGWTLARLAVGTTNDFLTVSSGAPVWTNPFMYEGTLTIPTVTSNGWGVQTSTHYQMTAMWIGMVSLTRWTSGYAKVRYSPDNATWTDIVNINTAWSNTFPLFLKKWFYYYVEVDSPVWGSASTASITALF